MIGNVGDSRAVLCSEGRAVPMSSDHKPNKPEERRRIQALGGRVVYSFGVPRGTSLVGGGVTVGCYCVMVLYSSSSMACVYIRVIESGQEGEEGRSKLTPEFTWNGKKIDKRESNNMCVCVCVFTMRYHLIYSGCRSPPFGWCGCIKHSKKVSLERSRGQLSGVCTTSFEEKTTLPTTSQGGGEG